MIDMFLKSKKFYPQEYHQTIYDIDFSQLKEKGIKYILVDLDNTLIPYDEFLANDKIKSLIKKIENLGFKIVVISNNREERVKNFCSPIKCKYIYSARKPFKCGFKKALRILDYPNKKEIALIGDQFMTDVFGGNRMGFYTIVVDAIKRKTEKWYTKMNRHLEKKVLRNIKRKNLDYYNQLNLKEKR